MATAASDGDGVITTVGATVTAGSGDGVVTTATAVGAGPLPTTGSSIPPRWTTNPNEIPALSTRMSSAARVARGTAMPRRGRGGSGTAMAPRR